MGLGSGLGLGLELELELGLGSGLGLRFGLWSGSGFGLRARVRVRVPWTSNRSGDAAPVSMVSSSEGRRMRNRGSLDARPLAERARVATPSAMQVGATAAVAAVVAVAVAVAVAATGGAGAGAITKRVRGERRRQARRGLVSPCARTDTPSPASAPPVVPGKVSGTRAAMHAATRHALHAVMYPGHYTL